jgi:prepilin-type processing-associated H-X9-DG protein
MSLNKQRVLWLQGFAISIVLLTGLVQLRAHSVFAQQMSAKARCARQLKGLGSAAILYSNDYRYFPHMVGPKVEHNPADVSKVFRSLLALKYIDSHESFLCPANHKTPMKLDQSVLEKPKQFKWGQKSSSGNMKSPILDGQIDPSVFKNSQLDYSYRLKILAWNAAKSTTILMSDKTYQATPGKARLCKACKKSQKFGFYCMNCGIKYPPLTIGKCKKCGQLRAESSSAKFCRTDGQPYVEAVAVLKNHFNGHNILYADGHVTFHNITDETIKRRRLSEMVIATKKKATKQ